MYAKVLLVATVASMAVPAPTPCTTTAEYVAPVAKETPCTTTAEYVAPVAEETPCTTAPVYAPEETAAAVETAAPVTEVLDCDDETALPTAPTPTGYSEVEPYAEETEAYSINSASAVGAGLLGLLALAL